MFLFKDKTADVPTIVFLVQLKPKVPNIAKENAKSGEIKEQNSAATTEWVTPPSLFLCIFVPQVL